MPPRPDGVSFNVEEAALGGRSIELTATVTWVSPRTTGVTVRVYSVTECLNRPTPRMPENAEGPCIVEDTRLPASVLELAATAPASDGTASWSWIDDSACGWLGPRTLDRVTRAVTATLTAVSIRRPACH